MFCLVNDLKTTLGYSIIRAPVHGFRFWVVRHISKTILPSSKELKGGKSPSRTLKVESNVVSCVYSEQIFFLPYCEIVSAIPFWWIVFHPMAKFRFGALPNRAAVNIGKIGVKTGIPFEPSFCVPVFKVIFFFNISTKTGGADHGAVSAG